MSKSDASQVYKRAPLFEANWNLANEEIEGSGVENFVLNDGTTSDSFRAQVAQLDDLIKKVNADEDDLTLTRVKIQNMRASTHKTMDNWRKKCASDVGDSPYGADLPTLPGITKALPAFLQTLREADERWIQINNAGTEVPYFTPPMIAKGVSQAQFEASIMLLEATGKQLETAENAIPGERAKRDNAANAVYQTETAYRKKVIADFPDDSPVMMTLPTLQPRDTGHTPAPVTLSKTYDPATNVGIVNWTRSAETSDDFSHYTVSLSPSESYKEKDATTIGTIENPDVLTYTIPPQYLQPGATVSVAVSVVLEDYRHAQSNAVKFAVPV